MATWAGRRALSDAGVEPLRHRPRARRDDEPGRDHAQRRAAGGARPRRRARRRDRHRRRLLRLPRRAADGRRPDRDRPRRPHPRDRRRGADPADSTSTTRRPPTCSATAPARSCWAPTATARSARSASPPTARSAPRSPAPTRTALIRMDGHSTYQTAVKRLSEATVSAVAGAGLELDDVDLFVYHQANGRIIRAVGERLDLEPAKVADYVAHMANTSAASIPLTLSAPARGQPPAPRPEGAGRRDRRGLHLGRRHRRMGDRMSTVPTPPSHSSPAPRKGIGAAIAQALAADGWAVAVNYRSDEDGANAHRRGDRVRRRQGRRAAGRRRQRRARRALRRRRGALGAPVLALVNNAGVHRRRPRDPARRRGLGHRPADQPDRRVPHDPPARCAR